ncbi:cytochrome P450 [Pluralibacter gergoviae]|uniref:cytochrome P450 n=1 Tax=Pluralibacter gergoviae TaxID=61647 RepID=UPI0005EC4E11|nr:cytochrome P450 [Pluralibacter gergoviae]KJM65525.1 cytochrome P450 [Pluralibacter gergoviae]OUR03843.1 cytochrome P450 [Pluralibacter gergoviae]
MSSNSPTKDSVIVPDNIARSVILPESYTSEDIFLPASKWLRDNTPVGYASIDGWDPVWLISKYEDVKQIEMNAALFPSADNNQHAVLQDQATDGFQRSLNNGNIRIMDVLIFMDPPEHTKIRAIANNWFMPANVRKFTDQMRMHAKNSVEHLLSFDGECDFMNDFAMHYPLRVIMSLFGVPPEDEGMMLKLTREFFSPADPRVMKDKGVEANDPAAAAKGFKQTLDTFYAYFEDLTEDRRRHPRDDLATLLATAEVDGQLLTKNYINGFYLAIATAGHDTTSASTTGALLGMMRHPEQWDLIKSDMSHIPGLIDESIRYISPVRHFMRTAKEDTEIRGVKIRKNDRIMLLYPSANRDEDVYENPDVFEMRRKPNRHLGFGFGPHMCIGQHVAKMELAILWEELLPKLKSVELAGTPGLAYTNWVGAHTSLPIRFVKA